MSNIVFETATPSKIILVRHGESTANVSKVFDDDHDDPLLTDKGRIQAKKVGQDLSSRLSSPIIYSSTLSRAVHTAEHIADAYGVPRSSIVKSPVIVERIWGPDFAGRSINNFNKVPGYIHCSSCGEPTKETNVSGDTKVTTTCSCPGKKLVSNPNWRPRGGESLEDLKSRVSPWIEKTAASHPNKNVIVVAHGHTLKALEKHMTDKPWSSVKRYDNAEAREFHFSSKLNVSEALSYIINCI